MPPETRHAIDTNNIYKDKDADYCKFIVINGFYIDEAGHTQVKVSQYTSKPIRASNSASHISGCSGRRTLTKNDIRDRILKGELLFDGKA